MRKVSVMCSKGGTGKSTTAVNVAAGLAKNGKRVLLIDCDAQGNTTAHLGAESVPGLFEVLRGDLTWKQAKQSIRENLDVISSNLALSAIPVFLLQQKNPVNVLKRKLESVTDYDFVILDCAPNFSTLHSNILLYADEAWIPVSMEYFALLGVAQLVNEIATIAEELETRVEIRHVIPTFFDGRNRKTAQIMTMLQEQFADRLTTPIRIDVKLSEAPGVSQSIFEYSPRSRGAEDYARLLEEVHHVAS
ncbi:MAG: ParA family protein [Blastocatellia bacterium]|nr:ParA family protein [Blastocatellia bacterium]